MRSEGVRGGILLGIILLINAWITWSYDGGMRGGVPLPAWLVWPFLFSGIIALAISIWGLLRKESKQEIEREAAKAKAKMDQMYFNEYGVWPDYKEEPEVLPKNQAKSGQAHLNPEADNANLKSTTPIDTKPPVD